MPARTRNRLLQHAQRLLLSGLCAACVGTPTPEPPDNAPEYNPLAAPNAGGFRPEVRVLGTTEVDASTNLQVPVRAGAGTVPASSEVTIINLDDLDSRPIEVRAGADGSFSTMVSGRIGQRVRVVYRSDDKHSLPLDLEIAGTPMFTALRPVSERDTLACVSIKPNDELSVVVETSGTTHSFTVDNRCDEPVRLDRAELRLGDQGFRLTAPPDSVAPNRSATLDVLFPTLRDSTERSDIVLLELSTSAGATRYALGVWSVPPQPEE